MGHCGLCLWVLCHAPRNAIGMEFRKELVASIWVHAERLQPVRNALNPGASGARNAPADRHTPRGAASASGLRLIRWGAARVDTHHYLWLDLLGQASNQFHERVNGFVRQLAVNAGITRGGHVLAVVPGSTHGTPVGA